MRAAWSSGYRTCGRPARSRMPAPERPSCPAHQRTVAAVTPWPSWSVISAAAIDRDACAAARPSDQARKEGALRRLIGVDDRTVSRWLRAEVDANEENMRAVARAVGERRPLCLSRLGSMGAGTHATGIRRPARRPGDPGDHGRSGLDRRREREELVRRQVEQIEHDQQRRHDEYEFRRRRDAS